MVNNKSLCHQQKCFLKRLVVFIFVYNLLITMSPTPTYAQMTELEAPIFIDNEPINTKYLLQEGHLLVPALFLKHTGVRVDLNEKYRSVVFHYGDTRLALPIGKDFSEENIGSTDTWKRSPLSTKTIEFDGQVFVPLIDIAEKFGMEVRYDPENAHTYISTNIGPAPSFINSGNPDKKLVALTFDDGPDDYYTPKILDILKEKNVKATFFVTGQQVSDFPNSLKRIVKEGHGIGNHTWGHPTLSSETTSKVIQEITSTQEIIQKETGRSPDLFRPPYREITKSDALILSEMGYRVIMWSVDTLDWEGTSAKEILDNVQQNISPGGIILQHNLSQTRDLEGTIEALPLIIDDLREKGYQFVTVQTLLDSR